MPAPASELLIRLFRAGLASVDPVLCLPGHLPVARQSGRTVVVGAGKAAAAMAVAVARHWARHDLGPLAGAVVTRYGHGLRPGEDAGGIEVLEAGHPVPDEASVAAGARILAAARSAGPGDLCLAVLSGGASSLLVQPAPGLTLADKQAVTRRLLASGAPIGEINAVRRRLSAIKGGGLARAIRAGRILALAISDVPGDNFADIGSGPLAPDPATAGQVRAILARHGIEPPPALARRLDGGDPAPGAPLPPIDSRIVASSTTALAAVAAAARAAGWPVEQLPPATGPARQAAGDHAAAIRALRAAGRRAVLVSGGETTVAVTARDARGGRNGEYLLALALELGPDAGVHALAADTDGIDGTGDNAGALLTPDTLARAAALGEPAADRLAAQRSHDFFAALGDLLVTGPTRTNVNDLRIALVE